MHAATCPQAIKVASSDNPPVKLLGVSSDAGLASVIQSQCLGCWKLFSFQTSPQMNNENGTNHFEINVRAVWGECASGGGVWKLNERMCTMGMPGLSQKTFGTLEDTIGQWWQNALANEMLEAGQEERRLAIERSDYHQGIPAISVICDGGWSKRSHKHTYNAPAGVAIIVGAQTKKLLFLCIRQKTCYNCTRAEALNVPAGVHKCAKNWSGSSQAMESDIILEGFNECESRHGLR